MTPDAPKPDHDSARSPRGPSWSLSGALLASGAAWGLLGLLVGMAGVGENLHLLRDAFADALIILALAALAASALASRTVGWAYVLILVLHAPIGSLIGLFMVMVIAGDRERKSSIVLRRRRGSTTDC